MWREPRSRTRNLTITLLLLGSLIASLTEPPLLSTLAAYLSTSTVSVERPAFRVGRWAGLLPDLLRRGRLLQQENAGLRRRVLELEDRLVVLADALAQSRGELAAAVELARSGPGGSGRPILAPLVGLEAEVAGLGADGWRQIGRIDLGGLGGVKVGYPVLWGTALVGIVQEAGPLGSVVRLTTDPESRIWSYDARSGVEAVAVGSGPDRLRLAHLRWPADIVPGDILLTTGKAGRLPRGLVVGEVVEVGRAEDGLSGRVLIRPRVSVRELGSVLVLPWSGGGPETGSTSR